MHSWYPDSLVHEEPNSCVQHLFTTHSYKNSSFWGGTIWSWCWKNLLSQHLGIARLSLGIFLSVAPWNHEAAAYQFDGYIILYPYLFNAACIPLLVVQHLHSDHFGELSHMLQGVTRPCSNSRTWLETVDETHANALRSCSWRFPPIPKMWDSRFASGKSKPIAINLPFGDVLYHENGDFGDNLFLGLPH